MRDWKRDLETSSDTFNRLVWPAVQTKVGGGQRVTVESSTATPGLLRDFDVLAGIDAWQICERLGMRGIASRIQPTDRCWQTFTIRYRRSSGSDTEFAKRLEAIESGERGWLYPHLTIQAYCSKDSERLLGFGVVKTRDLFLHAKDCTSCCPEQTLLGSERRTSGACYLRQVRDDGNLMLVLPWVHLWEQGVQIKTEIFES